MNPGLAFGLLMGLLAGDPLGLAQEAFARRDYPAAAALALAEARPPHEGAALDLTALALFRAGRSEEALARFDAAGRTADPPARARWQYNRGACLYDLGRAAEAEQAFLAAAERADGGDAPLIAAALANAGFAALESGSPERARALLARLRALPQLAGPVAGLADDLAAAIAEQALSAGAPPAPPPGLEPTPLHASQPGGPTSGRDGDAGGSLPGAGAGQPPVLSLLAAAGYDTNVLQSGLGTAPEGAPIASGQVASPTLELSGAAQGRWSPSPRTGLWLTYALDQVAYLAPAAEDYSLQQHQLQAGVEHRLGPWRLGLAADGYAAFTGLSDFRGLQGGGGLGGSVVRAWSPSSTTRLDAAWGLRRALSSEFDHLDGDRLDLALGQAQAVGRLILGGSARFRRERLGTLVQATQQPVPCPPGATCSQRYEIPYGYDGLLLAGSAQLELGDLAFEGRPPDHLALGLLLGWEGRRYAAPVLLWQTVVDGLGQTTERLLHTQLREDDLLFLSATARLRLGDHLWLGARYDLSVNASTVARSGARPGGPGGPSGLADPHALDYDDKNYTRQVLGLELTLAW